nr:uncharacterized protein LOC112061248 [Chrysemys picta bellii]XP_023969862.1 uncharacterized protein LOC112061248 [Chrysemys picta bellii]XP_042702158.1 uncharacterized protein LOC112061248 [Chrysemys picta bellii]XP_042702159.1 uncharacterized protein LOC112061248 [Chrysemys picta bellii]XP_042702160.1 uncharacterized protein LOC112061248 [Chrysemys picta bellii]XP_042702161.1 uncharacterized protein LOC112061248 [Chrysemys picta bellii]
MFAALYCVREIQEEEELKQCLDAWVLGYILANYKEESLVKKVTLNHVEKLHNFIRFFMGLLPYRSTESLLHDPVPLNGAIKNSLLKWFEHRVARDLSQTTTRNLLLCIFELHDASLTEYVSRCFEHIFLYNTLLSAADVGTLQYSLEKTTLDKVDLRGCGLGDAGLEQLSSVIGSSREVCLCHNYIGEAETQNITNFLKHREDLKVVMKITDDERLVSYVADRMQHLPGELQRYDSELVLYILQNLQNELEDEENLSGQMKENMITLKKNIAQLLADRHRNRRK